MPNRPSGCRACPSSLYTSSEQAPHRPHSLHATTCEAPPPLWVSNCEQRPRPHGWLAACCEVGKGRVIVGAHNEGAQRRKARSGLPLAGAALLEGSGWTNQFACSRHRVNYCKSKSLGLTRV